MFRNAFQSIFLFHTIFEAYDNNIIVCVCVMELIAIDNQYQFLFHCSLPSPPPILYPSIFIVSMMHETFQLKGF